MNMKKNIFNFLLPLSISLSTPLFFLTSCQKKDTNSLNFVTTDWTHFREKCTEIEKNGIITKSADLSSYQTNSFDQELCQESTKLLNNIDTLASLTLNLIVNDIYGKDRAELWNGDYYNFAISSKVIDSNINISFRFYEHWTETPIGGTTTEGSFEYFTTHDWTPMYLPYHVRFEYPSYDFHLNADWIAFTTSSLDNDYIAMSSIDFVGDEMVSSKTWDVINLTNYVDHSPNSLPFSQNLLPNISFPTNNPDSPGCDLEYSTGIIYGHAGSSSSLFNLPIYAKVYDENGNPITSGLTFTSTDLPSTLNLSSDGTITGGFNYTGSMQIGSFSVNVATTVSGTSVSASETIFYFITPLG